MATILSAAAGNWSAPTSWIGGVVPGLTDHPVIQSGHTVTLDVDANTAGGEVMPGGVLQFPAGTSRTLISTAIYAGTAPDWLGTLGNWVIRGILRMQPSSALVRHELLFEGAIESRYVGAVEGGLVPRDPDIGRWVLDGGKLEVQGTTKRAWTQLTGSAVAGATQIVVEVATGWNVGDELVICPTRETTPGVPDLTGFEERKVKAISGSGPYTVDLGSMADHTVAQALTWDHPEVTWPTEFTSHPDWPGLAPVRADVINMTRNVVFGGTSTGRVHCFTRNTSPVVQQENYARYNEMGPRKDDPSRPGYKLVFTGRWSVHYHDSAENNAGTTCEGLVTYHAMAHAFVAHMSNDVKFTWAAGYDSHSGVFWWDGGDTTIGAGYTDCIAAKTTTEVYNERDFGVFHMNNTAGKQNPTRPSPCVRCHVVGQYSLPGKALSEEATAFKWSESGGGLWLPFEDCAAYNCQKSGQDWWNNNGHLDEIVRFRGVNLKYGMGRMGAYQGRESFRECVFYKCSTHGFKLNITPKVGGGLLQDSFFGDCALGFESAHHVAPWESQFLVERTHFFNCGAVPILYDEVTPPGGNPDNASNTRFKDCTVDGVPLELAHFDLADMHPDSILVIDSETPTPPIKPAYHGSGHHTNSTSASIVLSKSIISPAPIAGLYMIATIKTRGSEWITGVPADWKFLAAQTNADDSTHQDGVEPTSSDHVVWIYGHFITQAEVDNGSQTWTWTKNVATGNASIGCITIANPHPTDPIGLISLAKDEGTGNNVMAYGLKAAFTDQLAVGFFFAGASGVTFTPDANMTERLENANAPGAIEYATEEFGPTHYIGDRTAVVSAAPGNRFAIIIGIKSPSSVAVPVPTTAQLVQEAQVAVNSGAAQVTFPTRPKHGNTIVLFAGTTLDGVPAYVRAPIRLPVVDGPGNDIYVYTMPVHPGCPTSFTLTPNTGATAILAFEFSGLWEVGPWDRKADDNSGAALVTSQDSGPTLETHELKELVFGVANILHNAPGTVTWNNGISAANDRQVSPSTAALTLAVGWREVTAAGAYSHAASWDVGAAAKANVAVLTLRIGENSGVEFFGDDFNRPNESFEDSGNWAVIQGDFQVVDNGGESTVPGDNTDNLCVVNKRLLVPAHAVHFLEKTGSVTAGRTSLCLAFVKRAGNFGHAQGGEDSDGWLTCYSFRWSGSANAFRIARHVNGWMRSLFDFVEVEPPVPYNLELKVTLQADGSVLLQGYANGVLKVQGVDTSLWRITHGEYMGMEHKAIHELDDYGMATPSVIFVPTVDEEDIALEILAPQSQSVPLATETDTTLEIQGSDLKPVPTAIEAVEALAIPVLEVKPLPTAPETDTALEILPFDAKAVPTALEFDTALDIGLLEGPGPSPPPTTPLIKLQASVLGVRSDIEFDDNWFVGEHTLVEFEVLAADGISPQDITDWSFDWVLRRSSASPTAAFTKTLASGLSISDGPAGKLRAAITADESRLLVQGLWQHALKRTNLLSETVLSHGRAVLRQTASR